MLLTTEELLQILMGHASPERLRVLLDRLDECPESAAQLRALVTLRANRQWALEILELEKLHDLDTEVAAVLAAWLILS